MDDTTAPDETPAPSGATPPEPADTTPIGAAGQAAPGPQPGHAPGPHDHAPGPQDDPPGPHDHAFGPQGNPPGPQGYPPGPQGYPPRSAPSGMDGFFASVRRTGLVRTEERWLGGVAGGLALRLGIDPLIVRGLLGVSVLLGGLGLVVYGVGWLLLPEQLDGRIHLQQLFRGDFDAAVIGGFALMLTGFAFPTRWTPFLGWGTGDSGRWSGFVGFLAVAAIVAAVVSSAARNRSATGPTTPLPRTGPPPTPTYPAGGSPTGHATAPAQPPAGQRLPEGTPMYPAPPAAAPHTIPVHYGPVPPYSARPMVPPPARPPIGPRTALPPRPAPRGPGVRVVGILAALGLLVLAGLLYAERVDAFDGPVALTAAAVLVVLSGLGIAVAGMLGRASGGLSAVAVVTILVVVPVAAASDIAWDSTASFVGDVTYTPTDADTAENGYSVGVGNVTLDLTDLPTSGPALDVPVHLGAGDLRVILPEDGHYTARVRLMAGSLIWLDDTVMDGVGGREWRTYESPTVRDGAAADLELTITVGAGNLQVMEESR